MDSGVFEVKATGGDTHLGGEDFDNTIFAHCLSYMEEKYGKDVRQKVEKSQRASSRLRRAVEQGK
eukprot:12149649-Ditylum_brightwellii.AAC.1